MRSWKNNKKGSLNLVVALLITVVVLVIGVYVLSTFQTSMPNITDATANATAENVLTAGWNAFGLAVVIPIIVVASAVIGYIVKGFMGGKSR